MKLSYAVLDLLFIASVLSCFICYLVAKLSVLTTKIVEQEKRIGDLNTDIQKLWDGNKYHTGKADRVGYRLDRFLDYCGLIEIAGGERIEKKIKNNKIRGIK